MGFLYWRRRGLVPRASWPPRAQLRAEALEARVVPYAVSGNAWPAPQAVTLSFVPDGTIVGTNGQGYIYSNLFATLNAWWPTSVWQAQIKLAAQRFAELTNLNFAVITDNSTTIGQGAYQQGDPGMGDIRLSGYNFGSSGLGGAFLPPPINNFSIAGDIQLNTGQPWTLNGVPGGYDLFTVVQHELGHALGLGHSSVYNAQMYGQYTGIKWALNSDDIAGIRNIYSANAARSQDPFDAWSSNGSFLTATDFTVFINPSTLTFVGAGNLDLTTSSDVDYYRFIVPLGFSGTLGVKLQSQGLSLLSPTVTVYNALFGQIGFASGAGQYGTTLNLSVSGLIPGLPVYVRVGQAETSSFGTGVYGLALNFGSGPMPSIPLPNTQRVNGSPPSVGGLQPEGTGEDEHGHHVGGKDLFPASATHDVATLDPASPGRGAGLTPERTQALASLFNANPARGLTGLASVAPTQTPAEANPHAATSLLLPVPNLALGLSPMGKEDPIAHVRSDEPSEAIPTLEEQALPGESDALPPGSVEPRAGEATVSSWRQASEAWFATTVRKAALLGIEDHSAVVTAEDSGPGQDVLPFLAASALVVSGVWGPPPQERERRRGQRP